ncbi:hypothetical protein [Nocardioides sp. TF02-7]|uniref:hypothetical protein n=1 Tax=Nocardioides sp. TF02-7 TaxID=2917724 RepID=UPI001F065DEF|nr:hypothetical protein [Nocardioides sp. TF02-7]UMG91134.1 hypothetical protein MF408_13085 [Nocardioides sp. TF02-7]
MSLSIRSGIEGPGASAAASVHGVPSGVVGGGLQAELRQHPVEPEVVAADAERDEPGVAVDVVELWVGPDPDRRLLRAGDRLGGRRDAAAVDELEVELVGQQVRVVVGRPEAAVVVVDRADAGSGGVGVAERDVLVTGAEPLRHLQRPRLVVAPGGRDGRDQHEGGERGEAAGHCFRRSFPPRRAVSFSREPPPSPLTRAFAPTGLVSS